MGTTFTGHFEQLRLRVAGLWLIVKRNNYLKIIKLGDGQKDWKTVTLHDDMSVEVGTGN